jgi:hypothetical protein
MPREAQTIRKVGRGLLLKLLQKDALGGDLGLGLRRT